MVSASGFFGGAYETLIKLLKMPKFIILDETNDEQTVTETPPLGVKND